MFGYGWCGGMGAGGWLLMAVLWAGFLAVIIWAVTRIFPRSRSRPDQPAAPGGGQSAGSVPGRQLAAGETGETGEDTYRRLRGELTNTG